MMAAELLGSLIGLAGITVVARSMASKTEAGRPPRHRASESRRPVSLPWGGRP